MKGTVFYGVLNWGLGHATRSIPIIQSLIRLGYTPIICSDGDALILLQREFLDLKFISLPAYHIKYSHRSMVANVSRYGLGLLKTIYQEEGILKDLVKEHNPTLIISDNRYGFHHDHIKSVMITHQLRIPAAANWQSEAASHFLHRYINHFDSCWVPDTEPEPNLSGKLSHDVTLKTPIQYIGPLSRFSETFVNQKYDIAFILSGPEPQRTYLEKMIIDQWPSAGKKCILVRGTATPLDTEAAQKCEHIEYLDLADSEELQQILSESKVVVSRAGYTTIMDLVAMRKAAILIPTPGQPEQEYLAEHLVQQFSGFKFMDQNKLTMDTLLESLPEWDENSFISSWSDGYLERLLEDLV